MLDVALEAKASSQLAGDPGKMLAIADVSGLLLHEQGYSEALDK